MVLICTCITRRLCYGRNYRRVLYLPPPIACRDARNILLSALGLVISWSLHTYCHRHSFSAIRSTSRIQHMLFTFICCSEFEHELSGVAAVEQKQPKGEFNRTNLSHCHAHGIQLTARRAREVMLQPFANRIATYVQADVEYLLHVSLQNSLLTLYIDQ